jgi:DNA-binding CsgD family transcriptional regulator/tetratricopeptide (TPR) repeat protein
MSAAAVVDRWPLVGRWSELDVCAQAASGAADGVVLVGDAGVGKTRLADELGRQLAREDRPTFRAVASRALRETPLGALAHLLPRDMSGNTDEIPELFRRALDTFAAGTTPVLVVDDLHLLDTTSLMLVTQLVANGLIFFIGTVRAGEATADGVDALLRSDRVTRIELDALGRGDVDTLLHLVLGAPLDGVAAAALWDASAGNPLFLRELVLSARASGALRETDGVWSLAGPLQGSGRLRELVTDRLATADPEAVALLETLACCRSVAVAHALELAPAEKIDALERAGLVHIVSDDRRRFVAFAHPLFGEVLRGSLGALAIERALVDEAARIERDGARRREDALLVASWRLDAGVGIADVELLLRAARLARYAHDFPQVAKLARAAYRTEPRAEAAQLLGEALYETGEFAEAEEVLAPVDERAVAEGDTSAVAVDVAIVRSTNLEWGLQQPDDATVVRQRARLAARDDNARALLLAGEAAILTFSGRPAAALDLLATGDHPGDERAFVARAIGEAAALAFTGRTTEALEVARRGFEVHSALGDVVAMAHPGSHVVAQVLALIEAGRLDEARALADAVHDVAVASGVPILRMWATINLGRVVALTGRPATARRWFAESAALAGTTGFVTVRRLALAGVGTCAAMLGDRDGAIAAAEEVAVRDGDRNFVAPELWLAGAWAAFASGEPARARDLLLQGAGEAAATGHRTSESWLLHDVARLGAPEIVTSRLAELASECDGTLVATRARHADALARHDAALLATVVEEFAAMGANLYAAEAAVAAADDFRRAGEQRSATSAQERANALITECEDARTPGLIATEGVTPLTRREREIATLAADGLASKDIAERLFLSVRTVDNHLQRVYTKLGVTKRSELGTALAQRREES